MIQEEKSILQQIINLIYPPVCAFCGKIDENFLCKECNSKLERLTDLHIQKYRNKTYTEHIYMFKYTDIRKEMLEYKFDDKAYYYKTIVQVFLNNKKMCEILKTYDIIIPVPIHNKRRKERGYNQSTLIAKEFSKNINGLKYEDILLKKKNTIAQSTLNKEERLKNAIDMYKIKENKQDIIYNKNVLIFDDIYTTGATANECAKAIRGTNPSKVGILTIAKD